MSNVNVETGIRYGVIDARTVPYLYDEITSNGTDLAFEQYKLDCIKTIQAALDECGQRDSEKQAKDIVSNFDWDNYQSDEPSYDYEDDKGNKFHLSHLGGATLIWCIKTSKIVYAKSLCSPCVPNAADLDSGLADNASDGHECYGVPDEWAGSDAE